MGSYAAPSLKEGLQRGNSNCTTQRGRGIWFDYCVRVRGEAPQLIKWIINREVNRVVSSSLLLCVGRNPAFPMEYYPPSGSEQNIRYKLEMQKE